MVFQTAFNKSCKWCAEGQCWGCKSNNQGKGSGSKGGGKGGGKGNMMEMMMAMMMGGGKGMGKSQGGNWGGKGGSKTGIIFGGNYKIDKSGGELGECVGTIKSFGHHKGFGFIESAEHGDVFLHQTQLKSYQQGQKVKFDAIMTAEGKTHAINLRSGLSPGEKPSDYPLTGFVQKQQMGWGGNSFGGQRGNGTFKIDKSGGELGEVIGTIKSFNQNKGYGFIETAEHGDVFLHADQIKNYQQGQKVKFDAIVNKEGKTNAINLKSGLK